ncbi:hypothetical protein D1007_54033 [Hordeum vulgare]|nr:hypothetical protein D1007_54033 [Hordeum vulgare]
MASVIPDGGGGDSGSDGSGGGTSLNGGGSFCEVDNWLGSTSYSTQAGLQQPEAPLVQSSPTHGCSMGCSEGYGESDYMYYVKEEEIGSERVKYLVHSDGSAEAVEMEIECASEEDRALEIECACEEDRSLELTAICETCISDEEEEDEVELTYLLKKPKSNKKKMKDRGLLKAIHEVFLGSPQRYCLRHIYAKFQSTGFKAAELKKLVDQASYPFTKHGHELAMAELKGECENAWKWLEKIPKETWCRSAMDYNCKTDLVVNNLSEVFNKMILDVRAKPIRTMFEGIRTKQMIKRQKTREKTESSRWMITPNYSEKLEENKKRWDMTGVTCSHAIAAMSKLHMHPEDFVHEFFKKPPYIEAYKDIVYPVPGREFWPDTHTQDIEPPVFKEKAGKKQTARRKGQFELPAPKYTSRMGTITCINCGLQGHRYTKCGKALKPSLQMRKNLH